jgi:hypothetical protein
LKGTSVGWFDVMSVFAGSWLWQVHVKEPERELSHVPKHWNRFERIIQDDDFEIKLGHGLAIRHCKFLEAQSSRSPVTMLVNNEFYLHVGSVRSPQHRNALRPYVL